MISCSLDRLLRPQTIAVFGGREARRVIEQCDRMGFAGEIWPVHPKLDEVLGGPAIVPCPICLRRRMPPSSASTGR